MNTSDIDDQVVNAFDELVRKAASSHLLGEIAMQPNGRHERTIADHFCSALNLHPLEGTMAFREESLGGNRFKYDILVRGATGPLIAVEVKTPFTNHDGIRHKTRRPQGLPKDMDSLMAAMVEGAAAGYTLITPIGCYPINSSGNVVILHRAIGRNEKAIKEEYGIQWPTRHDYETSDTNGRQEVDRAMKELARERRLDVTQIKGWTNVELPSPKPDIRAFLDCALYKVQLK